MGSFYVFPRSCAETYLKEMVLEAEPMGRELVTEVETS